MDRCLASEQVPFNDSTSSQEPSAQAPSAKEKCMEEPSAQRTSGEVPSAQIQLEQFAEDEGRKEETCVPSAQTPLAEAVRAVESEQGTPTEVLCEQVVPLLRYLDRKAPRYADHRHRGFYVELVRNRTGIKVATNLELISLDQKYQELEEKKSVMHRHVTLSRRLHKTALQLRDDAAAEAQRKIEKQHAKIKAELHSERAQNCILAEDLVRQTRLLEHSQIARKADKELLRRLQSQCDELRVHRAEAELQLVLFEVNNRRVTDRTREELVARVNRCLRGYTRWEIAARESVTLRELKIHAAALMSGDSRSSKAVGFLSVKVARRHCEPRGSGDRGVVAAMSAQ
ncbi:hypothetical protein AXG93_1001s1000 [Marchantia polymorpha subsp. ruderalis]|uniref:Uncharacterized protein n=1 Tax=Marchantia polymorpha subsp. ruderalis TaxID=1480154 RepID=A0A176W5S1_MARPO|nr:hypothetical protein AXG93_1001s1000 [Marchantia polymorpha subsp. ruderalis]